VAPVDRLYMTYYQSAIVIITLSCIIYELFQLMLNNITTLKSELEVMQGHWKWHHSINHIGVTTGIQ